MTNAALQFLEQGTELVTQLGHAAPAIPPQVTAHIEGADSSTRRANHPSKMVQHLVPAMGLFYRAEYNARIAAKWSVQLPRHPHWTVFAGSFDCHVRIHRLQRFLQATTLLSQLDASKVKGLCSPFLGGSGMFLNAGAEAYLSTGVPSQDLIAAIQRIRRISRVSSE